MLANFFTHQTFQEASANPEIEVPEGKSMTKSVARNTKSEQNFIERLC